MKKYALIIITALVLGISLGYSVSTIQDSQNVEAEAEQKRFCEEVERGIQKEMDEGFVNCFDPTGVNFELREDIRNSTSISCICRKKVGEAIQEIKVAKPN